LARRLRALDERVDELQVASAFFEMVQARRDFARRGIRGGERDARQLAVVVEIIEQCDEHFAQLAGQILRARHGLLHDAEPSIVRLIDQRLEQIRFVAEMIIQRGLGDLRGADDLLDGRGRVAAIGEMLQRRPENLLPRLGIVRGLSHKNLPNGR